MRFCRKPPDAFWIEERPRLAVKFRHRSPYVHSRPGDVASGSRADER